MAELEFTRNAFMLAISVISLIVSILVFMASSRQRHEKSAAEQAQISAKLDSNSQHLADIQVQLQKLISGFEENKASISALESHMRGLEKRFDNIEGRVTQLEHDIRILHTE